MATKKKSAKKTAGKKVAAKKAASASAEPNMTKTAFVRLQPRDMPAAEVIAKAAEAGITLTKAAVYEIRTKSKPSAKKKSSGGKKKSAKAGPRGDKKQRVLDLAAEHPDWTKSKIAKSVGCAVNYVYDVLGKSGQSGGAAKSNGTHASNGATTAFYRAVKAVGGIVQAKALLANIEAFQNA
jgi:hypothetical protein